MAGDKGLREQEFRLEHYTSIDAASTVGVVYAQRVAQSGGRLRRASFSVIAVDGNGGTALLYLRGSTALSTSISIATTGATYDASIKGGEVMYDKGDVFSLRVKVSSAGDGVRGVACDFVGWEGAV
jgi:hypothetical protein